MSTWGHLLIPHQATNLIRQATVGSDPQEEAGSLRN